VFDEKALMPFIINRGAAARKYGALKRAVKMLATPKIAPVITALFRSRLLNLFVWKSLIKPTMIRGKRKMPVSYLKNVEIAISKKK
jgi:hypothetical protein